MADAEQPVDAQPYRVLARKYRPQTFDDLIGQEAMVRTLTNAFERDRIAQAYLLSGVRGIGKTTTARIIARALNCEGPDGDGGPTIQPCGVCRQCRDIIEDRHVDVVEMDAASNNSVDNIREITEASRYRPASARYKVYILDEAHMLSNAAFNALLKTLEEPPPHLKFIFATTESRKLPVTVLSRCQRFDLRRVPPDRLAAHFGSIAEKEGARVEEEALAMIARAADGSVRDGLSLLDQGIALAEADGLVTADQVRGMLGLSDRLAAYDLFEAAMGGDAKAALDQFSEMLAIGADPAAALQDLMEAAYWTTRLGVDPAGADFAASSAAERERAAGLAKRLNLPALSRAWQLLSKGHAETLSAPNPRLSAEMTLIRLAYAAICQPRMTLFAGLIMKRSGTVRAVGLRRKPHLLHRPQMPLRRAAPQPLMHRARSQWRPRSRLILAAARPLVRWLRLIQRLSLKLHGPKQRQRQRRFWNQPRNPRQNRPKVLNPRVPFQTLRVSWRI